MRALIVLAVLAAFMSTPGAQQLVGPGHPLSGRWVGVGDANPKGVENAAFFVCDVADAYRGRWARRAEGFRLSWGEGDKYASDGPNLHCKGVSRDKQPNDGTAVGVPAEWDGWLYETTPGVYDVAWGPEWPPHTITRFVADRHYGVLGVQLILDVNGFASNLREGSIFVRPPQGFDADDAFAALSHYERAE